MKNKICFLLSFFISSVGSYAQSYLYPAIKNNRWGFIDSAGHVVIPFVYGKAYHFKSNLACVRVGSMLTGRELAVGYINSFNQTVINPMFSEAHSFFNNRAAAKLNGKWGFIDLTGEWVVANRYEKVLDFLDTVTFVKELGFYKIINRNGDYVSLQTFADARNFSLGLAPVFNGEKWGYVDTQGETRINFVFVNALPFSSCDSLAAVKTSSYWTYINLKGEPIVAPVYDFAHTFSNGLAAVKIKNKWGFIDRSGKEKIKPLFDNVKDFNEHTCAVAEGSKWGFIDTSGAKIIIPEYDYAESFVNGRALVKKGGKMMYIDRNNKVVWRENP